MTQSAPLPSFPDPVVTANVYCDRRQDQVVHGALAPLRRTLAERDPEGIWRLWFLRYPRRGEHLKVRLHGPEAAAPELRDLLTGAVEACFAALPPSEDGEPRKEAREAPPVDLEDNDAGLAPDRSLLWTRYQRHPVSLGGKPLIDDGRYVALMTTCLSRACEIVVEALQPDAAGQFPQGRRQTGLLRLVTGGLGALGFGADKSAEYLAYHRDWLLRFTAARSSTGTEKIQQTLGQFDQRADKMADLLDAWRAMALDAWSSGPRDSLDGSDAGWWRSLRDLQDHLDRFRGDPDYQLDPYATDNVFSSVFKAFHGSANQIGLNMLNEAFAHHLLWRAVTA